VLPYIGNLNVTLNGQISELCNENSIKSTRLDMVSILTQIQVNTDAKIKQVASSLAYASEQLSTIGLEGDQTREVLNTLITNNSFSISASTQNLNHKIITAEPIQYHTSEGEIVIDQIWVNTNSNGPITHL
jgi:hypothetical protein